MAKPILVDYDFGKRYILNFSIQVLATAPDTPNTGQVYYDSTLGFLRIWDGDSWHQASFNDFGASVLSVVGGALTDSSTLDFTSGAGTITASVIDSPLLGGNDSAWHRDRANHTGTQAASTISDFALASYNAFVAALTVGAPHSGITIEGDADPDPAFTFTVTNSPLLNGQNAAYYRNRANHTGTQTASTISDFDTQVRTNRLDQMAAPTADVSMNGQKLTNLAAPTAATDAATKGYVDNAINGVDWKPSVTAATTANVALTAQGSRTIDGVSLDPGDRVLLKNQTAPEENGLYAVQGDFSLVRTEDADTSAEVTPGLAVFVEEGAANGNQQWVLTTDGPIVLGTTALTFTQIGAQGSAPSAGAGLTLTSNEYAVGAGTGINVGADSVSIDTTVVTRKVAATLTTSATSYVVPHNLGTTDVLVAVYRISDGVEVEVDVTHTDNNNVTIGFAVAPAANAYRVVVHG